MRLYLSEVGKVNLYSWEVALQLPRQCLWKKPVSIRAICGKCYCIWSPTLLKEIVGEILSVASSSASSPISQKTISNVGSSTASSLTFMEQTDLSHILLTIFITYLNWEKVTLLCMYPLGVLECLRSWSWKNYNFYALRNESFILYHERR